jgi:hypothetical protein
MATRNIVTYGVSSKGHPTILFRGFEYVKVSHNQNGKIYWRIKMYQNYKGSAHLKTQGDVVVGQKDKEYTH